MKENIKSYTKRNDSLERKKENSTFNTSAFFFACGCIHLGKWRIKYFNHDGDRNDMSVICSHHKYIFF